MSTAAVIGAPPAPVGRRVLAALVDGAGTALCALPIWLSALTATLDARSTGTPVALSVLPTVIGAVLLVAWGVTQWVLHGTRGWTLGRRLCGLRVVDALTGRPIGLVRALVRGLIVALGALACGVGQWVVLASVFWDPTGRRRGWHDRVAEAVVVDVRGTPATARLDGWRDRPAPERVRADDTGRDGSAAGTPGPGPGTSGGSGAAPGTAGAAHPALSAPAGPVLSAPAGPPAAGPAVPGTAAFGSPVNGLANGPAANSPAADSPAAQGPAVNGPAANGPAAHGPAPHGPAPHGPAADQTRWAGMVASGQQIQPPGLVLPPIAATTPPATTPPAATPPAPEQSPVGGAVPGPYHPRGPQAEHAPDLSRRDPDALTIPPGHAAPDDSRFAPGAPVAAHPGGSMHDTTQIPQVTAEPAGAVPAMDPFWSEPDQGRRPQGTAARAPQDRWAGPAADSATAAVTGLTGAAAGGVVPDRAGRVGPRTGPAASEPVPAAPEPAPTASWAARLPDGTVLDLEPGPVLIGRNPAPLVGLRAVAVQDPSMSVSKTHLVIGADVAGAWVMDRGSTNGTMVTLPDGQRIVCQPDQRVRVAPGSVVFFGDLTLTVGLSLPG